MLFALLVGGFSELFIGAQWFQHGSPLYRLFGMQPIGFGWQFLYVYFLAWIAALVLSYKPIFANESAYDHHPRSDQALQESCGG